MNLFKKIAAGFCLSLGFAFLLVTVSGIVERDENSDRRSDIWGGLLFGVPTTVAGGWLIYDLSQKHRQQKAAYIRSKFYSLIKEKQGIVGVLDLAMEAQISGEQARFYLEQFSQEFAADFEITEENKVIYRFSAGE